MTSRWKWYPTRKQTSQSLENDITVIGEHLEINNGIVNLLVNDQIVVYKSDEIVTIYSGHKENFSLQWFGYGGGTTFITLISIDDDIDSMVFPSILSGIIIGFIVPQIIKLSGPKIIKCSISQRIAII